MFQDVWHGVLQAKRARSYKSQPHEYFVGFRNLESWRSWSRTHDVEAIRQAIIRSVQTYGLIEPFTGYERAASEVKINPNNLHETLSCKLLNSRKRALLMVLDTVLRRRGQRANPKLRLLSADAISRVAKILRGEYPYFLGTEYLPTEEARREYFPIPHMDLQDITYPDESFDVFVSADVFEHIPRLDLALAEIFRVLKPGGVLVSSFPFSPHRRHSQITAEIGPDGEINHLREPEYHGDPVNPGNGVLVYSVIGWSIFKQLKSIGFSNIRFEMVASARHGVVSDKSLGPMVLVAKKEA